MHGSADLPRFEQPRGAASNAARAARIAARPTHCSPRAPAEDGQPRAAHPSASSSPSVPPPLPIVFYTGDSLLERELAVHAAGLRTPAIRSSQAASAPAPIVPKKPSRTDPLNREPTAKPATIPKKPSRIDPLNREPGAFPNPEPRPVHRIHNPLISANPLDAPHTRSQRRRQKIYAADERR